MTRPFDRGQSTALSCRWIVSVGGLFCGGLLGVMLVFAMPVHTTQASRAVLSIAETSQDLRHNDLRQRWSLTFSVANQGDRRLVLNEIGSHCGCDDDPPRTIVIQPGDRVDIELILDTRTAIGPVQSVKSFTTNDPSRPRLDLTVSAFLVDKATRPTE